MERSPSFLFFGVIIPIWIMWLIILYVFAAEINCFIYVINRSRHWHLGQHRPSLLNIRTLKNGKSIFYYDPETTEVFDSIFPFSILLLSCKGQNSLEIDYFKQVICNKRESFVVNLIQFQFKIRIILVFCVLNLFYSPCLILFPLNCRKESI